MLNMTYLQPIHFCQLIKRRKKSIKQSSNKGLTKILEYQDELTFFGTIQDCFTTF